jgi:hypothetical protein
MWDQLRRLELYYDSSVDDPREDPAAIADRLERVAAQRDVEYETIDFAETDRSDRPDRQRVVASVRSEREYAVDGRVFTDETFGRLRPVLVVRYGEEVDGIDLYPHRSADDERTLVRIGDFLDELDPGVTADRSDYAGLAESDADDGTGAERERGEADRRSESGVADDLPGPSVDRRTALAGLAGAGGVVVGALIVGVDDVPVVGAVLDCGPGETRIADISGDAVGTTVEIMGTIDYSLDDTAAFTGFRLDGQTGSIPVYLEGEPDEQLEFGECLRVRGEVMTGEEKPVEGPVVGGATVVETG